MASVFFDGKHNTESRGSFCPLQRRRGPAFFADFLRIFLLFLAFETAARASLRALRAPLRAHGEPVLNVIHSPWGVVLIFQWSLYYGDFYKEEILQGSTALSVSELKVHSDVTALLREHEVA